MALLCPYLEIHAEMLQMKFYNVQDLLQNNTEDGEGGRDTSEMRLAVSLQLLKLGDGMGVHDPALPTFIYI